MSSTTMVKFSFHLIADGMDCDHNLYTRVFASLSISAKKNGMIANNLDLEKTSSTRQVK